MAPMAGKGIVRRLSMGTVATSGLAKPRSFVKGSDPAKMTFETPSTVRVLRNAKGVLSGEEKPRSFQTPETLGSFDARVAISLSGYRSQPYARLVDPQGVSLRLTQQASSTLPEPLVRFNLFGGARNGYFCPEPIFGIQNSLNLGKGVVRLQPGKNWKWRLELQVDGPPPAIASIFCRYREVWRRLRLRRGPSVVKSHLPSLGPLFDF